MNTDRSSTTTHCDKTPAWAALTKHHQHAGRNFDIRTAFANDATRFATFSCQAPHVFADLSKNYMDATTRQLLLDLAHQTGVIAKRDALFAGDSINSTENRSVMHWLLRAPESMPITRSKTNDTDMAEELAKVHATLAPMLAYAEHIRADDSITDVVNIGIGGSDLGPQMAVLALASFAKKPDNNDNHTQRTKRLHFVSNVDGHELSAVLHNLRAESTLFLIASKTFTTTETMTNARSAKVWFDAENARDGTTHSTAQHFAALTTNVAAANAFGITTTFGFWDWVGGRYSMWSAIGLPIAIAVGGVHFRAMLAGAADMDEHFKKADLAHNLPVQLALLDVWYRNFHGFHSRCVAPYHSDLKRLPAYLQQLEMESNGKRVDVNGKALSHATSAVIWGEPGTNGQHAFFQMLHQGTDVIPLEFIAVKKAKHDLAEHQPRLLANALAQAQAFLLGQIDTGGHKHFTGNRPSTFLLLDELTPTTLGALVALYEHRVLVAGCIWGINSFDQWGVELGKVLAVDIEKRQKSGDFSGLDGSTAGLLSMLAS